MKVLDMESKLEALENDLFTIYQTTNALHILLDESSVTVEQAENILRKITRSVADTIKNVKHLTEETAETRKILESI